MKILKTLIIILVSIILIVFLILGYFGFVPGVSKVFGSDKPRDLGVEYIQADIDSAFQKNNIKRIVVDSSPDVKSSFSWEGSQQIIASFTDKEITGSMSASNEWALTPVTNVQVKFFPDGTAEASAVVRVDKLKAYADATKVSQGDIQSVSQILDKYNIPRIPVPLYMKGNITIKENKLDINLSELQIGKLALPESLYKQAKYPFENFVNRQLNSGGYPELYIKSLDFSGGKMNFNGTIPKIVTTAKTIIGEK